MAHTGSANFPAESVYRIEPTALENLPTELADVVAELSAKSASLGDSLHPRTGASLARLVRIMNAYYSNLIEGNNTRPREIERALAGRFDQEEERRNLQLEAASHVRIQAKIDELAATGRLPEPASESFVRWLHREFYGDVSEAALRVRSKDRRYAMQPGEFRSQKVDDVAVGRHQPPSSSLVPQFMAYFEERYQLKGSGKARQLVAMGAAHHRFNYIHPFPDGNGRVSRLMSHAMAHCAGIGAHGLWSVSRGLARGLNDRDEYKQMMDYADTPRKGDLDGRGNLSYEALVAFVTWFLRVCVDQVEFMAELFELNKLTVRLRHLVEQSDELKAEAADLLVQAAVRGQYERGEAPRITGLPERTARRVLNDLLERGLLASETPKSPVFLQFPQVDAEILFPRLFAGA